MGRPAGARCGEPVTVLSVVCCLAAGLLGHRGSRAVVVRRRLTSVVSSQAPRVTVADGPPHPWRLAAATCLGAVGVFVVLGGWPGVVGGLLFALWAPSWLAHLEPRGVRRRREARRAELPMVFDLLAACLSAGGSPAASMSAVAGASCTSLSGDLEAAARSLRTGATPVEAFAALPDDLAPLARAFERSGRTGAAVAQLLASASDQLRAEVRAARLDAARRMGVTTAAPLGLCFLPGFVVLGLVPVVIGLVQSLA